MISTAIFEVPVEDFGMTAYHTRVSQNPIHSGTVNMIILDQVVAQVLEHGDE